jgi:trans-aconitate methyltransferase
MADVGTPEALTRSAARAGRQYDAIPYPSYPIARLHPARLAAVAGLFGLAVPEVETARTLEIGCASGGHLIPLAAAFPQARFLGIDVSANQIASGRARINRLGLANIDIETRSLAELRAADGKFDFIVCHGVYSWIAEPMREALMRVCKKHLASKGIAVISFNVLPGWRMFQIVRDSAMAHADARMDYAERPAAARRLFDLLAKHTAEKTSYGNIWRTEAQRMSKLGNAYLAHELFEQDSAPCTFSDFAAAARRHGLGYLGETDPAANIPENSGLESGKVIRGLSGDDFYRTEQYFDIVTGRTFRHALVGHESWVGLADRSLPFERLDSLHLTSSLDIKLTESERRGQWSISDGDSPIVTIAESAAAEAMRRLIARLPSSSNHGQIAPPGEIGEPGRSQIRAMLMQLVCSGSIACLSTPVICAAGMPLKPKAWRLAASDAAAGMTHTATLRHAHYEISRLAGFLLPLADGSRDRQALVECLFELASGGGLQISEAGAPVIDKMRLKEICIASVDKQIADFARVGLLAEE